MSEPVLQQGQRGVVGKGRACGGLYSCLKKWLRVCFADKTTENSFKLMF